MSHPSSVPLLIALVAHIEAQRQFQRLSTAEQQALIDYVNAAKRPQSQQQRIDEVIKRLSSSSK